MIVAEGARVCHLTGEGDIQFQALKQAMEDLIPMLGIDPYRRSIVLAISKLHVAVIVQSRKLGLIEPQTSVVDHIQDEVCVTLSAVQPVVVLIIEAFGGPVVKQVKKGVGSWSRNVPQVPLWDELANIP